MFPLISIVITTRNEEKNIKNCLKSIVAQSYLRKKIEIIVVDNNSTDKTKKTARLFTPYIYNFGPERSAQRNCGVRKSKGMYYMYIDADMILSKGVVEECVKKMQKDRSLIALYIPEIILGKGFWGKARNFERSFYNGTVIDSVRFIRTEIVHRVSGFDESMSGPEDWDFDKKVRRIGKIGIIKSPIYHNESNFNLFSYLDKKRYYMKSFNAYIKKWGNKDPDIKKQFGLYYRFIGVFIEEGKWKRLIKQPILFIGMVFLKILVGFKYISQH